MVYHTYIPYILYIPYIPYPYGPYMLSHVHLCVHIWRYNPWLEWRSEKQSVQVPGIDEKPAPLSLGQETLFFLGPGLVSGVYHGFTTWLMLRGNGPKENTRLELVGRLEHEFYFSIWIGNFIIPTDELIFFRGVGLNHQPGNIFFGHPIDRVSGWNFSITIQLDG